MTLRPFLRDLTSAILRETPAFDGAYPRRRAGDSDRQKAADERSRTVKAVIRETRRTLTAR